MAVCTEEDSYTTSKTFELAPESKFYSETFEKKIDKPVFVTKLSPAIVTVGNTAKFTAVVAAFPKPVVQWYHNGRVITTSSIYTFVQEKEEHTLVISNVKKELEGEYTCTASNRSGESTCTSYLHVKVKDAKEEEERAVGQPPYFTKEIEPVHCTVGSQAVFKYSVTGSPFPEIHWFRGTRCIESSKHHIIASNLDGSGCLTIMEIQQSDSGLYSCRASNPLGEAFCKAELIVFLDTVSASQSQERFTAMKQKSYKVSTYEHATESRLYSVSHSGHARASQRQAPSSEKVDTLRELDVSFAAVHNEQVIYQAPVSESPKMQERVALEPQKQLHVAAVTSAVQESQSFPEQHSGRIKSPEVIELRLTEEHPSRVMSAISQSVTPLTIVKAEPLVCEEGERIHATLETKHAVRSHQVETKLAVLNEQYKNIPFPKEEKSFRVSEGVRLLYSATYSENLPVTEAHSSPLPSLETTESSIGKQKPAPILAPVSDVTHTLSKEGCLELDRPVQEVAQLSKDHVLKSAFIASEKHTLHAEQTASIPGLDSAVSVRSRKEEDQVLHLQVVSDQDTFTAQGRFTSEKPRTEQADAGKSSTLLQTASVDEQTAVRCEHLTDLSSEKMAECIKPSTGAPAKIYAQSMQTETTLHKEGVILSGKPDKQKASQRHEKDQKCAVSIEERLKLTADSSTDLKASLKGVKPEQRKEPEPHKVLHVVSEPRQLSKETPLACRDKEHRALVQKEDSWNIKHAMSVLDKYAIEEGRMGSVKATERYTCKVDLEPKPFIQSVHIEEQAISTESCAALEAAEKDYAVHIQEGQSVKRSILIEEKKTLTGEICTDISKSETTSTNILTEPSGHLLVTESQESKALPKELTFVIPAPKPHSLDIKHQLKNALQCAVAYDQPLILADVVGSLKVVEVKEVKVHKEPKYAMFSYLITTTSVPVEITIAFEGEYPQFAHLRSELQSALSTIIYQEHQVFTSEQPEMMPVLRPQQVSLQIASSKEMLSPVVESVQFTEHVETFAPSKGQSAALETEAKETFQRITRQERIVVQESERVVQMAAEAKSDIQDLIQARAEKRKDGGLGDILTEIPVLTCQAGKSTDVRTEEQKRVEFIKEDVKLKRTSKQGLAERVAFDSLLEDIAVRESSVVSLTAQIQNVNRVSWFFNGKLIKSGKEFKCSEHNDAYTLIITNVTRDKHEGEYTCEAVGEGGKASTSSRLTVLSRGLTMELYLSP